MQLLERRAEKQWDVLGYPEERGKVAVLSRQKVMIVKDFLGIPTLALVTEVTTKILHGFPEGLDFFRHR